MRIDLSQATFIIPIRIESPDRLRNVVTTTAFLLENFNTNIIIKEVDAELGTEIEELMFVFDNLKDVDDRGIQTLLREVSSDILIVALKGADTELQEKIFSSTFNTSSLIKLIFLLNFSFSFFAKNLSFSIANNFNGF